MLKPDQNRLNYSDLLEPPSGYEIVFGIGTTYSLDLEALVGVPVALSLTEEMDQTFQDDPIYVLEGLRRTADKFAIFCEPGQIKVPHTGNSLFALLEDSVFEVAMENEKSFHPKMWLIKYQDNKGNVLYRLLVLTRNLTFDRSWDIALALEGTNADERTEKNKPLADLLHFLVPFTANEEKVQEIKQIIVELPYIHFDSKDKSIPDFDFCPIGIEDYGKEETEIFTSYQQLVIMSPFISGNIITELSQKALTRSEKVLITRKSELSKLSEDILTDFDVYVLRDTIIEGEGAISEQDEEKEIAQLQDIHAKLYAKTKYSEHYLYIGSANSSNNAFQGNVEFLLRLKYKKRGFKVIDILKDLFGETEEDNPFEKIDSIPVQEEAESKLTDKLQRGIKKLCRTESRAFVTHKNDYYKLHLFFDEIPGNINFSIGPLLSKKVKRLQQETVVEELSLLELGEFYRVTAEKDGERVERTIKVKTEGIPEERNKEIFRSLVNNPQTFLRYVAFLLSDDFLLSALEQLEQKNQDSGAWGMDTGNYPVLYENMLKAASRDPEKLQDVQNVISIIDNDEVIPREFNQLYETFSDVAKKVSK